MITPYLAQQPIDDFGFPFSKLKYNAVIPIETQEPIVIPSTSSRYKAIMSVPFFGNVLVAVNNLVTPPLSPTFIITNAEAIPIFGNLCREVKAGDTLYFYNAGADVVTVQIVFYSIGQTN